MKKIVLLFVLVLLFLNDSISQKNIYDYLALGKYNIGYTEDILYIDNNQYEQYNYKGKAPIFLRIWHPVESEIAGESLAYHSFFYGVPQELKFVYGNLVSQFSSSIYETVFKYNIVTGEELAYDGILQADLIGKLAQLKLKSKKSILNKNTNFPVIIYHHGTQGSSIENVAMAEFFASRGYIFIAANFHLPYKNQIYGLEESVKADFSAIKLLNNYARKMAGKNPLIYIGHSWGAQVGWCYLHEPKWADVFISMETTIERKTDEAEIKDKWPFVYDVIKTKAEKFEIPILMFANEPKNKKSSFFENANLANTHFVSPKIDFAHESYTSIFFSRLFIKSDLPFTDAAELEKQLKYYIKHLELMDDYLTTTLHKKKFKHIKYWDNFNIFN